MHLDGLLPDDHQARIVWEYASGLDLSALYATIQAVEGAPGHPPIDPRIMLALWLFATLDGVGSARAIERLCDEHIAYQWICGGVSVNNHTLSAFRVMQTALLDRLLTQSVAVLRSEGLVDLQRVAQDGVRVRASAGAPSFRRKPKLETFLEEARQQVERLRRELDEDPASADRQRKAARLRAAEARRSRVAEALRQLPELEAKRSAEDKEKARASTTDPDARVMKMPDGGFRPAFNVQFATATNSQVIVGVDADNVGNDNGHLAPMVEQIVERHGISPSELLVDGGFAKHADFEKLAVPPFNATVYAPVMASRGNKRDPHEPLPTDTPTIRTIYKLRSGASECVNALARNRGLTQFLVRGRAKVRAIALWFALAHNVLRAHALRMSRRIGGEHKVRLVGS